MRIKFAGPKPLISHTGIDFDTNKEDKFLYLNIALQLIHALDHDYIPEKTYVYHPDTARLSEDEISHALSNYCENLESIMNDAENDAKAYILEHIEHARDNRILNEEERSVLVKNYEIMRSYIIQRYVNKAVYYCAISVLADIMRRGHIDYVIAPMFERFTHVFHSVQGVLQKGKAPIDSKIEIYEEGGKLLTKLDLLIR